MHGKKKLENIKKVNGTQGCYFNHWIDLVKQGLKDVYLLLLINLT
jgi:hypothetical protein